MVVTMIRFPSLPATALLATMALCSVSHAADGFLEQIDLFDVGDGKYKSYRIPCLLALPDDTVLAFTSARKSVSDWANIDVLMRRSTDGGKTWAEPQVIADYDTNTADNPVAIYDREQKAVHFLHQVNYEKIYYLRSDDGGKTFSKPVDITGQLEPFQKIYPSKVIAPGPGHGIQLKSGRLVVPVWLSPGKEKEKGKGREHHPSVTAVIYSDDHGKTWQCGDIVPDTLKNPNETVAVEADDGGVYLYVRNEDSAYRHAIAYSKDGVSNWTKPVLHEQLYTPICFASVLRLSSPPDKSRLLFSNPDSHTKTEKIREWGGRPRENLTLRLSYDDGKTWPVSKVIESGRSAYSDLAILSDGTILCLYERGFIEGNDLNTKLLTIARFNLEWLTDGKDSLKDSADSSAKPE